MKNVSLSPELLKVLRQADMPTEQYMNQKYSKNQIVLHHTASGGTALGDINYWNKTKERVATFVVIDRDGTIYQCFNSEMWAAHIGAALPGNRIPTNFIRNGMNYDRHSIGIEVDNWGYLTKGEDGKFRSWTKEVVPEDRVVTYKDKFRGHMYYEKYTDAQIESLRLLLEYLCEKYEIPADYNDDIFAINYRALNMKPGIFTHCSYRSDKTDIHPQPEMISMLKSLTGMEEETEESEEEVIVEDNEPETTDVHVDSDLDESEESGDEVTEDSEENAGDSEEQA